MTNGPPVDPVGSNGRPGNTTWGPDSVGNKRNSKGAKYNGPFKNSSSVVNEKGKQVNGDVGSVGIQPSALSTFVRVAHLGYSPWVTMALFH